MKKKFQKVSPKIYAYFFLVFFWQGWEGRIEGKN
jgi:hypothetical protein